MKDILESLLSLFLIGVASLLVGLLIGWAVERTSIKSDCDLLGRFSLDANVYACQLDKKP